MTPAKYDFPDRVRTPGAADRETSRIRRSLFVARLRGDLGAVRYLTARLERAEGAAQAVHRAATAAGVADARDATRFADLRRKQAARAA